MNDPSLKQSIQSSYEAATLTLNAKLPNAAKGNDRGILAAFRRELEQDEEEEEVGYFQPKRWWFTSTAFPLVAGTFGPLTNVLSICALLRPWRQHAAAGSAISDPGWLNAITALSLALSLIANAVLLANFGHVMRYSIAQPLTIGFWYSASILLIVPLGMTKTTLALPDTPAYEMSQTYYYAIISACIYTILATLLALNAMGAYIFHAYPASFKPLTIPQRTLMLQTIFYVLYLSAGAGVFARIEGWEYLDGIYWADYTLLTIGLGSDFPLKTHAGRALLIPFAVGGITLLGLVIGSIRGMVLERGRVKDVHRTVAKEREKWMARMDEPDGVWKKEGWEAMRRIQRRAETLPKYHALGNSTFAFLLLWFLGALVFFFTEAAQSWTYFEALYFSYATLLTIGYGDFIPRSNAGKPFFIVWSLIAVPTMTILISNVGDILVRCVRRGLLRVMLPTTNPRPRPRRRKQGGRRGKGVRRMGSDIEHLVQAVENVEAERGRESGLGAQLAREVSRLAREVASKPTVEYGWEDMEHWLELIGAPTDTQKQGVDAGGPSLRRTRSGERRGEWTWLGEEGPLLSGLSETQWVLQKLCDRLAEVSQVETGAK
ncbi:hypothetical protein GGX14DRAFT_626663 [Mycena pura]|uniref:Potassium channel domain-containing protein n=1 Tax=Mycena pura TaxID=153505 RepID=A0AAD6YQN0_9AGAR|nr:hypothetical protein GGX14DRAFT_626663 [Mycena pura]